MSATIRKCSCGKSPTLNRRPGQYWYCCPACGEAGRKEKDIQAAAHEWNKAPASVKGLAQ